MKILVIGSEGFIGKYMVKSLKEAGHSVIGFDVAPEDAGKSGYVFHRGNILNKEELKKAASGVDMVINLAAKHHDFGISREEFFAINETGTKVMLDALTDLGIKKLIFFSSVAVYGKVDEGREDLPMEPVNDYGDSKKAGELLIHKWAAEDKSREVVIVRPVVVFGPHNYANVFRLIDNIYRNRFLMIGDGKNIKSVAYVENLVGAALFMLGQMKPGSLDIINYSDQPYKTSLDIANIIRKELGKPPLRFKFPLSLAMFFASPFDLLAKLTKRNLPITAERIKKFNMPTVYSSQKVRDLGYQQKISTEEGLHRMVEWYIKEGRFNRERCAAGPRG